MKFIAAFKMIFLEISIYSVFFFNVLRYIKIDYIKNVVFKAGFSLFRIILSPLPSFPLSIHIYLCVFLCVYKRNKKVMVISSEENSV